MLINTQFIDCSWLTLDEDAADLDEEGVTGAVVAEVPVVVAARMKTKSGMYLGSSHSK